MFRSKTTIKSSNIPTDVADLINEIDAVVASPFDKRPEKEDDDLIVVGNEEEVSAIPTKTEETTNSIPCDDDERHPSPDLSMNVSELSLDGDLAFLGKSIQSMSPETVDESREEGNVTPQEGDASNLLLANVDETPGDSTKLNENDVTTDSDEFNPFVNIGNRLLDTQDTLQETTAVMKRALTKVSTTVLFVCVLAMYLYGWTTQDLQEDSPSVMAENVVDSFLMEEMIPVSSVIPLGRYLTWKSTITEEAVPEVMHFESILELDSANQELFTILKVLALCLAACSVLGIRLNFKATGKDNRAHYEGLHLKDLQRELRHRNLCISGLHGHLVDRLVHHDQQGEDGSAAEISHVDLVAVQKHMTVRALKKELASRGLPRTGLKDELISKVWIPARIKELEGCRRDELRQVLKRMNLSPSGMKEELIVRLVEAGH
jgi:hypothetical protein